MKKHNNSQKRSEPTSKRAKPRGPVQRDTKEVLAELVGKLKEKLDPKKVAATTVEAANRFLREHYIAEFNHRFQVAPAQRGNAFLPCPRKNLDLIFSLQFERTVNRDNTVSFQNLQLQIERVHWRGTLAGCNVMVHQHLDGTICLTHGPHRLGRYTVQGVAITSTQNATANAVEKTLRGNVQKTTFPPSLEIPPTARDSHFPTATTAAG